MQRQMRLCIPTFLLLVLSLICFSTEQVNQNELWYPNDRDEYSYAIGIKQDYALTNYVLDAPLFNLCETYRSTVNMWNETDVCNLYFCDCELDERVCYNLTYSITQNDTFRYEYFHMINYCVHCNNPDSQSFRIRIGSEGMCPKFPQLNRLQSAMVKHCNNGETIRGPNVNDTSSLLNDNKTNLGVVDWRNFVPGTYFSNRYWNNQTDSLLDNSLHLFESVFRGEKENPLLCWCRNRVEDARIGYAYQCDDAYYQFLVPFKYLGVGLIMALVFFMLLVFMTVYIAVPMFYNKFKAIQSKVNYEKAVQENVLVTTLYLKYVCEEFVMTDLKPLVLVFLYISITLVVLENLFSFFWNFTFWNSNVSINVWGLLRSLEIYFASFSVSSLMVQWSHIVDLLKNNVNKKPLSLFNGVLLGSIYLFNVALIIIGIALSAVFGSSTYLYTVAGISMIFMPSILLVLFTIYGVIIYKRISLTATVSVYHLKFTKFIILFNVTLAVIFVIATITIITFIVSWDVYGLFYGVFKTLILDILSLAIFLLMIYILVIESEIEKCYGDKIGFLLLCKRRKKPRLDKVTI